MFIGFDFCVLFPLFQLLVGQRVLKNTQWLYRLFFLFFAILIGGANIGSVSSAAKQKPCRGAPVVEGQKHNQQAL
jgi:hypothetical protein